VRVLPPSGAENNHLAGRETQEGCSLSAASSPAAAAAAAEAAAEVARAPSVAADCTLSALRAAAVVSTAVPTARPTAAPTVSSAQRCCSELSGHNTRTRIYGGDRCEMNQKQAKN